MKWYTSDLHFHHKNVVKFTDRGVATTQENHDEWLIELWNKIVVKGNIVYHLGDFSFARNYEDIAEVVQSLNGQKIFIKGNHDRSEHLTQLVKDGLIVSWHHYKEIKIANTKTCLFHFPISSWNGQGRGTWHLHGHSHGNHTDGRGKMLDVGIDFSYNLRGKHQFFSEESIVAIMDDLELHIADYHREAKVNL